MTNIKAHQLTEGQTVVLRGKLEYSRLMSMIDGEELQRRIAQQRQLGSMYITDKPHTTVTLRGVQVIYSDPNNPTVEEQYVAQKCYNSKKHPDKGLMFNLDNKSPFLPPVWVPANPANLAEGYVQLTDPEGELDSGLDISLILTTFKAGNNANLGLGLDSVVVNEEPRYYSNNRVDRDKLAALGIVFNSNPVNPSYNVAPQAETQQTDQPAPAYTDNQGLPTPGIGNGPSAHAQAPAQQAQPQPQQNQAPAQAAAQPQVQQQVQPQQQAPQNNQYAFPQQGQPQQAQPQPQAQPQNQYAFPQQAQQGQPQQPQPQVNPNSAFNVAPQAQPNTNVDPWTGEPIQGGITYN